jgi:hypothetical protein
LVIGKGVPSSRPNEFNGLEGDDDADGGHFSISIHRLVEHTAKSLMVRTSRFTLVSEADFAPSRSTEMRQEPTKAHNCSKLP